MKKLLAILLLATMIFSAVACATENDPIDTDETQHNTESELKETETETETGTHSVLMVSPFFVILIIFPL